MGCTTSKSTKPMYNAGDPDSAHRKKSTQKASRHRCDFDSYSDSRFATMSTYVEPRMSSVNQDNNVTDEHENAKGISWKW